MSSPHPRVLVAGGVSWDTLISLATFPEPRPQTVFTRGARETVGGTGAGKALNLAKLGLDTTLHALLGADEAGARCRAFLEREGVTLLSDVDPQGTERHVNLMADDGGRISLYVAYASSAPPLDLGRLERAMVAADHVVINILDACRPLLPMARRLGKSVWTDLHDWDGEATHHLDFARAADRVFLSSDRLLEPRPLMQRLHAEGNRLVVCTHGRRGATALTAEGAWLTVPSLERYRPLDTNGAGDAFFAGFLAGHARGCSTERCLRVATVVAGLCVTSPELALLELTWERVAADVLAAYGEAP
jgi:acarbose 7IV-phosphotransferase